MHNNLYLLYVTFHPQFLNQVPLDIITIKYKYKNTPTSYHIYCASFLQVEEALDHSTSPTDHKTSLGSVPHSLEQQT